MKNNLSLYCLLTLSIIFLNNIDLYSAARITTTQDDELRNQLGLKLIATVKLYRHQHEEPYKIEELLKNGADIDFQDSQGHTSLMNAVLMGNLDAMRFLIKLGANVNVINHVPRELQRPYHFGTLWNSNTALMIAAHRGCLETVKILIKNKADVNITDMHGETALIHSVDHYVRDLKSEAFEIVKLLIESGANANAKNIHGANALVRLNDGHVHTESIIRLLIDSGADIDCMDTYRLTPLFNAVSHKLLNQAKLLLSEGASLDHIYRDSETILDVAKATLFSTIIKLIEDEPERRKIEINKWQKKVEDKVVDVTTNKLNKDISKLISEYVVGNYKEVVKIEKIEKVNTDIVKLLLKASSELASKNKLKRKLENDFIDNNVLIPKKSRLSDSEIRTLIGKLNIQLKQLNEELEKLLTNLGADSFEKIEKKQEEIDEINQQIKLLIGMLKSKTT